MKCKYIRYKIIDQCVCIVNVIFYHHRLGEGKVKVGKNLSRNNKHRLTISSYHFFYLPSFTSNYILNVLVMDFVSSTILMEQVQKPIHIYGELLK